MRHCSRQLLACRTRNAGLKASLTLGKAQLGVAEAAVLRHRYSNEMAHYTCTQCTAVVYGYVDSVQVAEPRVRGRSCLTDRLSLMLPHWEPEDIQRSNRKR